jgi:maltooligosyltrehalose trehalohydrolase
LVQCNNEKETIVLQRWHEEQEVICFLNFSAQKQHSKLPSNLQCWKKLLDSADPTWHGPEAAPQIITESELAPEELILQPQSILIYSNYTIH